VADRALFVGWGEVVRGREMEALANFNDVVGYYGKAQQEGRIESFDVCLLEPHGGDLDGFMLIHGSQAQLDAFRQDDEFRRLLAAGSLIVDNIGVIGAAVGEGVARELSMYTSEAEKLAGSKTPA